MSQDIPLVDWRPAGCSCDLCRPEPTDPAIRAATRQYSRERIAYLETNLTERDEENTKLREENQALQADLAFELEVRREYDKLGHEMIMEVRAKNVKLKKELNTAVKTILHLDGWLAKRDEQVMDLKAALANRQELIVLLNEQNNEKNEKIKGLKWQLLPWCNRKECPFFPM